MNKLSLKFNIPIKFFMKKNCEKICTEGFQFKKNRRNINFKFIKYHFPGEQESDVDVPVSSIEVVVSDDKDHKLPLKNLVNEKRLDAIRDLLLEIYERIFTPLKYFGITDIIKDHRVYGMGFFDLAKEWRVHASISEQEWTPLFNQDVPKSRVDILYDQLARTLLDGFEHGKKISSDGLTLVKKYIKSGDEIHPSYRLAIDAGNSLTKEDYKTAIIDLITALEIVTEELLRKLLKVSEGLSKNRIDKILVPGFTLMHRYLLLSILGKWEKSLIREKREFVFNAINRRNKIIHKKKLDFNKDEKKEIKKVFQETSRVVQELTLRDLSFNVKERKF